MSNPDYSETGYQDPTDYPALLIKIVKDLAKKGLSNGLEIITFGSQMASPKELQSFSNISYIQLPRELNGKINSFVRDGLFFCTSGDAVVAVGDNPNLEAINFQWDDFSHKKVSGSSDLFKGGQTLITHNEDAQRFVMIGEDDFLKKYVHQGCFFLRIKS